MAFHKLATIRSRLALILVGPGLALGCGSGEATAPDGSAPTADAGVDARPDASPSADAGSDRAAVERDSAASTDAAGCPTTICPVGQPCNGNDQCSNGNCYMGTCACNKADHGYPCVTSADCCSPGTCYQGVCVSGPACMSAGATCQTSTDCCSGSCFGASGSATCMCTFGGEGTCRTDSDCCNGQAPCIAGQCTAGITACSQKCSTTCPAGCILAADCKTCLAPSNFAGEGTSCTKDSDCCLGSCSGGFCTACPNDTCPNGYSISSGCSSCLSHQVDAGGC